VPGWGDFILKGIDYDRPETLRTVRHIFRSLWVYYAIMNNKFEVDIKSENFSLLKNTLNKIYQYNSEIFPLILLFHDIGRPFNKEWHTFESANMIKQNDLLSKFQLSLKQQLILYGTIKYHLLPGTIYTGESSYYGAISIFNDKDLRMLWQSTEDISIFFHILNAFTLVDIWGYDYSKIYDHYFRNYDKIRLNLSDIFNKTKSFECEERSFALFNALSNLDKNNLKWRISCALRIFQFIETSPDLMKGLYFSKVDEALAQIGINWNMFTKSLEDKHTIIQFKYGLPLVMLLASGSFKREPINHEDKIDPKLFYFWQNCCKKVSFYLKETSKKVSKIPRVWNFIFGLPRDWFFKKEYMNYIRSEQFLKDLRKIPSKYDPNFNSYFVNFKLDI
jgi:hypothetical protein